MANELAVEIYTQLTYNAVRNTGDPQTDTVGGAKSDDPLGRCWVDLDPTLGRRTFKFVSLAAGSATPGTGGVLVNTDAYGLVVDSRQAQSVRTFLAGVTQATATPGKNIWIQTDGYHAGVQVDNSNPAKGDLLTISGTDLQATKTAVGTAPPYPEVGTCWAAPAGNPAKAAAILHCGKFSPSF